jgi:hypothetical protein
VSLRVIGINLKTYWDRPPQWYGVVGSPHTWLMRTFYLHSEPHLYSRVTMLAEKREIDTKRSLTHESAEACCSFPLGYGNLRGKPNASYLDVDCLLLEL